jgi:hypothetical protein
MLTHTMICVCKLSRISGNSMKSQGVPLATCRKHRWNPKGEPLQIMWTRRKSLETPKGYSSQNAGTNHWNPEGIPCKYCRSSTQVDEVIRVHLAKCEESSEVLRGAPCKWCRIHANSMKSEGGPLATHVRKFIEILSGTPCKWCRIRGNQWNPKGCPLQNLKKFIDILRGAPLQTV